VKVRSGLGNRIRAAREAAGLTVTAAADRVGVKQQQWDKWENQGVIPSDQYRGYIAEVLGIDRVEFDGWIINAVEQRYADKAQELVVANRDNAELRKMLEQVGECHNPPISRQACRKRYDHPKARRVHE